MFVGDELSESVTPECSLLTVAIESCPADDTDAVQTIDEVELHCVAKTGAVGTALTVAALPVLYKFNRMCVATGGSTCTSLASVQVIQLGSQAAPLIDVQDHPGYWTPRLWAQLYAIPPPGMLKSQYTVDTLPEGVS